MVALVRRQCDVLRREGRCAGLSRRVEQALLDVPREHFVPRDVERDAYADSPLPIGRGQTISQPLIVALMTDLAHVGPDDTVLEVGTGSGYGAAVLSRLAARVCTLEVLPDLAARAAQRLASFGAGNVDVRTGDAWAGWPGGAPTPDGRFDAVLVTCAAPEPPPRLLAQLRPGGRLVVPLGPPHGGQVLSVVTHEPEGGTRVQPVLAVAFVPMVHEDGDGGTER